MPVWSNNAAATAEVFGPDPLPTVHFPFSDLFRFHIHDS
jgi:hypothetical protein